MTKNTKDSIIIPKIDGIRVIHDNFRSKVWVDKDGNIHKIYKSSWKIIREFLGQHLEEEIKIMRIMQDYDFAPKLINYDEKTGEIVMSDCATTLSGYNGDVPMDFETQLDYVYEKFKEHNIYNRDFFSNNTCIKQGKIYIIDFGFAEILKPNCKDYDKKMNHMREMIENLKLSIRNGTYEKHDQSESGGYWLGIAILAIIFAIIILIILFLI